MTFAILQEVDIFTTSYSDKIFFVTEKGTNCRGVMGTVSHLMSPSFSCTSGCQVT
jgi:hypothetical protein